MYIAFEGIDGSGKTTIVELLTESLASKGKDVLPIRMPGHTKLGTFVRNTWHHNKKVRFLSLTANHVEVIEEVIEPHLAAGGWVVQDRTYLSSHIYFGFQSELNYGFVTATSKFWIGRKPDKLFLLDTSAEIAYDRLSRQEKDLPDPSLVDLSYLRLAYKTELTGLPNCHIIETDNLQPEEIIDQCLAQIL